MIKDYDLFSEIVSILNILLNLINIYFLVKKINTQLLWKKTWLFIVSLTLIVLTISFITIDLYDVFLKFEKIDKFTVLRLIVNTSIVCCYIIFIIIFRKIRELRKEIDKQKEEISHTMLQNMKNF